MTNENENTSESTLITSPNNPLTAPTSTKKNAGRGNEETCEIDEIAIPRAVLVQFTSKYATTADKDERREPGTLINSITKENLGNIFIPIFRFITFTCWNPRKKDDPNFDQAYEPGELIFSTNNRRDPRVVDGIKFGENGEAPKVTKYINFLSHFINHPYPLILSFSKTSFKGGKNLNFLIQCAGGDMFSRSYKLTISTPKENYFTMDVSPHGHTTKEEFAIAENWYNEFKGKNICDAEEQKLDKIEAWGE